MATAPTMSVNAVSRRMVPPSTRHSIRVWVKSDRPSARLKPSSLRSSQSSASFGLASAPHLPGGPDKLDRGHEVPVEFRQACRTQALDFAERGRGVAQQRADVHVLAARRERRQVPRSTVQHVDGAVMIQLAQVVERDADLEDALVQIADVAPLGAPE